MPNSNDFLINVIDKQLKELRDLKTKDRFDNVIVIEENGNAFKFEFQDTSKFAFKVKVKVTYRLKDDRKLGIKVFNNSIENIVKGYNYAYGNIICDISRQERSYIDVFIMYLVNIIKDLKR